MVEMLLFSCEHTVYHLMRQRIKIKNIRRKNQLDIHTKAYLGGDGRHEFVSERDFVEVAAASVDEVSIPRIPREAVVDLHAQRIHPLDAAVGVARGAVCPQEPARTKTGPRR